MFKWFSRLNNIQRLSVVMALIAVIFTAILLAVMTFKNKLDSELNNPVVGLLNAQKDAQASAEEAAGLELKMDKTEASVEAGKTLQLTVKIEGDSSDNKVQWDSSDEKIAIVDSSGLVTAKAVGTVTIRAKLNDRKTAISVIKVMEPPKPEPPKPVAPAQNTITTGLGSSVITKSISQMIEDEIFRLVNLERQNMNRPIFISQDPLLVLGARIRSVEESRRPQLHKRADGIKDWDTIFNEIGYKQNIPYGENLGYIGEFASPIKEDVNRVASELVSRWMTSNDGHRENILGTHPKPNFNSIGIGVNFKDGYYYAVQLFAQK